MLKRQLQISIILLNKKDNPRQPAAKMLLEIESSKAAQSQNRKRVSGELIPTQPTIKNHLAIHFSLSPRPAPTFTQPTTLKQKASLSDCAGKAEQGLLLLLHYHRHHQQHGGGVRTRTSSTLQSSRPASQPTRETRAHSTPLPVVFQASFQK